MNWNKTEEALNKRGFVTRHFDTAQDARAALLALIPDGSSIGLGGSVTVASLNVFEELEGRGCKLYSHSSCPPEKVKETLRSAEFADFYLTGCNAVSEDGVLYNIDARGNRVSAMLFGPGELIFIVGNNKIVEAGKDPFVRIREEACPANCRRLGRNTPCAKTGKCAECTAAVGRICNAFVKIEHPSGRPMEVWLVEEALGY